MYYRCAFVLLILLPFMEAVYTAIKAQNNIILIVWNIIVDNFYILGYYGAINVN